MLSSTRLISIILMLIVIGNGMAFVTTLSENHKDGTARLHIAEWLNRYNYNEIISLHKNNVDKEEKIQKILEYIKKEPYMKQNTMYEIMADTIVDTLNENNIQEKLKQIDNLKETLINVKMERNYDVTEIQKRADMISKLSEKLEQKNKKLNNNELELQIKELSQILINEYPEKSQRILEYDKNHEGKTIAKMRYESYTSTYKNVIKKLKD